MRKMNVQRRKVGNMRYSMKGMKKVLLKELKLCWRVPKTRIQGHEICRTKVEYCPRYSHRG